jgi:hypothetical protein
MNDNPAEDLRQPANIEDAPRSDEGEFDDDTLAELWHEWTKEAERLGKLARGAFLELQARMSDRKASKLDTPHWSGTMKPGSIHHTVDDPVRFRERLAAFVGEDDLAAAFVQPPAPRMYADHRRINELDKRGGVIAKIIDEERRSIRGEDVLVLMRKEEAKE